MRITLFRLAVVAVLGCGGVAAVAGEVEQLREKAAAVQKEAANLAEKGRADEAERLRRAAVELLERAERMEMDARKRGRDGATDAIRRLEARLRELAAQERKLGDARAPERELAEVREMMAATERELTELRRGRERMPELPPEVRERVGRIEAAQRAVEHLRAAAENLEQAGVKELPGMLMEKADEVARAAEQGRKEVEAAVRELRGERDPGDVRAMQAEIERLKAEVAELREQLEKRR